MTLLVPVSMLLFATPAFQPFDGKSDGFRVDFPGKPTVERSKDKTSRTYTVDTDFGIYAVSVFDDADYTPDDTKSVFDDFRKSEKAESKLIGDKPVSSGSVQGLELKTRGKDSDGIARQYVGKGRSWLVTLDVDHGHTFEELGAERFFNSFTLGGEAAPVAAPSTTKSNLKPPQTFSADGVEVAGFTPDGSAVVVVEHGVEEGRGYPWANVTFFDTAKGQPLAKPLNVVLETTEKGEAEAVAEAWQRIDGERARLKLAPLVRGKSFKTTEAGAISGSDGGPLGNLEIKSKNAGKKESVRACEEPWKAQLYTVKLFLMGGDAPIPVVAEKKVPAQRACSESCTASASYGQGKGAFFVVRCRKQDFEGFGFQNLLLPIGNLEFPLEADL